MQKLAGGTCKPTTGRARGRPSPDVAAQIDEEILRGAREMFFTHGYERTSMAMVTQAAGVSKTTLYARYDTKADLFRATAAFTVERIMNASLKVPDSDEHDLEEGLRIYGAEVIRLALASPWCGYERLINSEGARFPELAAYLTERIDARIDVIAGFIMRCGERSGTPMKDPRRIGQVARVFMMTLRGFINAMMMRGRSATEEEIASLIDDVVDVLMGGRAHW